MSQSCTPATVPNFNIHTHNVEINFLATVNSTVEVQVFTGLVGMSNGILSTQQQEFMRHMAAQTYIYSLWKLKQENKVVQEVHDNCKLIASSHMFLQNLMIHFRSNWLECHLKTCFNKNVKFCTKQFSICQMCLHVNRELQIVQNL